METDAAPQEALSALLSASATGALNSINFSGEHITFATGASFAKDTLVRTNVEQPYRLDVLCFFAQFRARQPGGGGVNPAAYLKEARTAGVATVAITDRSRLLAFLAGDGEGGAPHAKRARVAGAAAPQPASCGDGLLPGSDDVSLGTCAQLHDRNSILLSKHKTFGAVLELLQNAMKGGHEAKPRDAKAAVVAPPALKSSRYKEVQEQRFWQERLGTRDVDELGIDTNASFLADAVQPLPAVPPAAAPPAAPPAFAAAPVKAKAAPPASASGRLAPKEKEGGTPIIIVPSGLGSQVLLNMFNSQPFFEDCAFVPWEQRKSSGVRKEAVLEVKRRSGRSKPVVYHVTDKPPPPKSPDWARVVAVFVQGAMWQFRDFPYPGAKEGNLLSTFEHVKAFFVRYDSEPLPDFVKKWSVSTLELSKNARHSDRSIIEGFWQALDHSLQMKRSQLNF